MLVKTIALELAALLLALVVYYANDLPGPAWFAGILAAANACALAMYALLQANTRTYLEKTSGSAFVDYLHRVLYRVRSGHSYTRSLVESAKEIRIESLRRSTLVHALGRLMDWDAEPAGEGTGWIETEIQRHSRRDESRKTDIEEGAQRYATFNMFLSTVLPSFLVFAFIGDSILSHAYFGMLLFSFFLVFIMPVMYSAGSFLMWRRLFA